MPTCFFLVLSFSPNILRRPDLSINNSLIQWRVMTQRPIVTKHSHVTLLLLSKKVYRSLSPCGEWEGGLMSVLKPPGQDWAYHWGLRRRGIYSHSWPIKRCEMLAEVDGETARRESITNAAHTDSRFRFSFSFSQVNLRSDFRHLRACDTTTE